MVTWLVGIAAFFAASAGVKYLRSSWTSAHEPPLQRAMMQSIRAQGGLSEFQRWVGSLPPSVDAGSASMQLVQRGLLRLSSEDQAARLQLLSRRLDVASATDCGAIARGTPTRQQQLALIGGMDQASLDSFATIVVRAMLAEIRGWPLQERSSDEDTRAFLDYIASSVSAADSSRLETTIAAPAAASDEDACWLNRLFYSTVLAATPDSRNRWVRVITTLEVGAATGQARPN